MHLKLDDLKTWLHKDLSQRDKLLLILSTFDVPCSPKEVKDRAAEAGFRAASKWNVSTILGRSAGYAIRVPNGWEITDAGKAHLRNLGISSLSPAAVQVAVDLRNHLVAIQNAETRAFVEEAVKCYEAELYRSAIVMSWLAAIDVLHKEVVKKHLSSFNAEATRLNAKWKKAANEDGLGLMKEHDFLQVLQNISVIGKNVKDELQAALKRRNGAGHPNSLKFGANAVAHHIETLLLNVFQKFHA